MGIGPVVSTPRCIQPALFVSRIIGQWGLMITAEELANHRNSPNASWSLLVKLVRHPFGWHILIILDLVFIESIKGR